MMSWAKYVLVGLVIAAIVHIGTIHGLPRVLMNTAMQRLSSGHYNTWHLGARVTPASRSVVRPSPDLAYSACPYDLSRGPVRIEATPWDAYWSLSLYADNSDNFYVIDDREAHDGVAITLVRAGATPPARAANVVRSPSTRGIALIRRLAPTPDAYARAAAVAAHDVCTGLNG
jgi:uncharacterized membrane protein